MSRFDACVPVLRVPDPARSQSWYEQQLGFTAEPARAGSDVLVRRDGVAILLRSGAAPTPRGLLDSSADVYVELSGGALLDVLEQTRRRTPLVRGPEVMPDGRVEFELEDPDGYRLCFAESLADASMFPPAVS